jgi:tetratricopeptide (TPR) repeat protein
VAAAEGICLTAMERDPADRYRSAAELAREVERWLAGEPVRTNYVEPQPVRLLRWARTNRGLAVMAALIVVSLGALAVAVNVIRVERQDVREQAHEADEEVKARLHRDQDLLNEVIGQRRHASEELGTALQALRAMALKSQPAPGDGPTLAAYKADLRQTALNGARRVAGRVELARGSDLAAAHDRLELGALFEVLGQPDEAQWQYQRAVQIAQGRAREEPDNLEAKRGLVLATRTLGQLCLQRGQAVFARSLARQALPAAEACTKAEPNNLAAKHEEALCLRLLANADEALHDLPAARGDFDKLIVAVEGYASADPNNLGGRIELANAYAGRGQVERLDYRFDEALNWYDRALAILQPLDKDGKLKPFPQEVARLKELKQTAGECRSSLKAVEDINYALTEPDYRAAGLLMSRAGALARRGRVADAAATAEKLRELKPHDGTNLYNVARALALCATGTDDKAARAEYTRRAVEALRAAAGHGFHDLKKIESEPDLDVLRADPGYRAFVAREVWLTFPVLP